MKLLRRFGNVVRSACVWYTALTLVLYVGGKLASGIEREWILTLPMMFAVLAFSILFSAVNDIVLHTALHPAWKLLLHYAATAMIFYVLFIVWGGYAGNPSSVFMILLAFTVFYAIAASLYALVRHLLSLRKNSEQQYDRQFHDRSDDTRKR